MLGQRHFREDEMGIAKTEKELGDKAKRYLKAELKRAGITYKNLAERLREHGLEETEASITSKISRGTFAATFFIATVAAIGKETLDLSDL